ncbi:hypothetical protein [Sphingobium aromaticiconvertens]|uniref:hypothetical protein n=1 Tax=Sphingobium aromaticiconvertens TaxID=365341 RepID=UPI0030171ACD
MADQTEISRASRRRLWIRVVLAGPVAILVALTLLAGMPLWLPGGAAGIDNLALPLIFAPLIWAGLFFHACLDRSLMRVALVAAALFLVHGGLVASRLLAPMPPAEKVG